MIVARESLVGELENRGVTEVIRVRRMLFGERPVVDVRIFFEDNLDDGTTELRPSRKGIGLTPETWRRLLVVIAEAVGTEQAEA